MFQAFNSLNVIYVQNTKLCFPIRFVRVNDLISWTLALENRKIKLDFLPENKNLFFKSTCWETCHMSSEMMPLAALIYALMFLSPVLL